MEIDWSKAPEGTTHAGTMRSTTRQCWYKRLHNKWFFSYGESWGMVAVEPGHTPIIERPAAWTGEGLPPVGIRATIVDNDPHDCYRDHVGADVEILAHTISENDQPVAVYKVTIRGEVFYHALIADRFRPIRTPEQIAAEEREKAIKQMMADTGYPGSSIAKQLCDALYDSGYHK